MHEKHGLTKHAIYTTWRGMRDRCKRASGDHWEDYGGRGIKVCPEWDSFPEFFRWAQANNWAPGLTLDRIDVDGDYTPQNCRWATAAQQSANRRPTLPVTINGKTLSVRQWSIATGIFVTTLYKRYHAGIRGKAFIAPPKNPAIAQPIKAPKE